MKAQMSHLSSSWKMAIQLVCLPVMSWVFTEGKIISPWALLLLSYADYKIMDLFALRIKPTTVKYA